MEMEVVVVQVMKMLVHGRTTSSGNIGRVVLRAVSLHLLPVCQRVLMN